jgi:hypothetical protein
MHTPANRVDLHGAASYIVGRNNHKKPASNRIQGFLQVCDATKPSALILVARLGNFDRLHDMDYPSEVLTTRISKLVSLFQEGLPIDKGFTSSDLGAPGGAVIVDDLVFSFASQHWYGDGRHDEAFTLMIAIRAGLLSSKKVSSLRCTPGNIGFNPTLRRLMNTITWTS